MRGMRMEKQTSIADNIDVTEMHARYDEACKTLLSSKVILAWILKSTVKEFAQSSINDIAGKYIEGTPQVSKLLVNPGESNAKILGMNSEDTVLRFLLTWRRRRIFIQAMRFPSGGCSTAAG